MDVGIDKEKVIGQCYDGASVMSAGVQALVRMSICFVHTLFCTPVKPCSS